LVNQTFETKVNLSSQTATNGNLVINGNVVPEPNYVGNVIEDDTFVYAFDGAFFDQVIVDHADQLDAAVNNVVSQPKTKHKQNPKPATKVKAPPLKKRCIERLKIMKRLKNNKGPGCMFWRWCYDSREYC